MVKAKDIAPDAAKERGGDLLLLEMANLESDQTGVEGTIYISTRQGSHAPRVKYYAGRPGEKQPSMSILIAADPDVVENSLPDRIASRMAPRVQAWVRLNHDKLRDFWFNGNTWYQREVESFIAGLEKYRAS